MNKISKHTSCVFTSLLLIVMSQYAQCGDNFIEKSYMNEKVGISGNVADFDNVITHAKLNDISDFLSRLYINKYSKIKFSFVTVDEKILSIKNVIRLNSCIWTRGDNVRCQSIFYKYNLCIPGQDCNDNYIAVEWVEINNNWCLSCLINSGSGFGIIKPINN